ncbi:hypothetical protein ACTSEZ_08205 [Metabacillus sp. JX24]|uniref:hypothetical protein n=1 Tax=Metabacillus sp. JX24 TaxID=3240759 RepID=UPI00350EB2FD
MTEFPIIHTNFWDAVIAVPAVVIITQIVKLIFKIPPPFVPSAAGLTGLLIGLFISHPNHFSTGLFMGFFYGSAAAGAYSSLKTSLKAYRRYEKKT